MEVRPIPTGTAALVLIVNLFLPGIGTIIYGASAGDSKVGRGIAQLVLALFIIGWVWALIDSIRILTSSGREPAPVAVQPGPVLHASPVQARAERKEAPRGWE